MKIRLFYFVLLCTMWCYVGCDSANVSPVVVTATFDPLATLATPLPIPTTSDLQVDTIPSNYVVQGGDTLLNIAQRFGLPLSSLIELNNLPNPNLLMVGQVIELPNIPVVDASVVFLIPDEFLPYRNNFDVQGFLNTQQGWLKTAVDQIELRQSDGSIIIEEWSAYQIIEYYAQRFSVDPRILLTFLELRSGGLTQPIATDTMRLYPLGKIDSDRQGITKQINWAYNQLNDGYYGWLYRGLKTVTSIDAQYRIRFHGDTNAASVAVQYLTAQTVPYEIALDEIVTNKFQVIYEQYFGMIPPENRILNRPTEQPLLELPFAPQETWYFTGGAHGGWGSGSEWAAIDLAPPDERSFSSSLCYVSQFPVRAVGDGVVAISDHGRILIDLDYDGDIATGWNILYLHVDTESRLVSVGESVKQGDPLGYTSCEGGFSTATHLHIARLYNGEWIPADCSHCQTEISVPSMQWGQWRVQSLVGQEYQGFLLGRDRRLTAEQGRLRNVNEVIW
ncbi:MAG: LysM peptidoglycan-binding domain-containing protein [Phototrophicaceae bacterium]